MYKDIKLICITPTKTLTKGASYKGTPIKKGNSDGSYNGTYTTQWVPCAITDCTSFELYDDIGIVRRISIIRFNIN